MPTPVSPTKMNATDPKRIGGVWSFIKRFNDLIDWIISLSPTGVINHDTDWVDCTYASDGYTADTPGQLQVRRIGKTVYIRGGATGPLAHNVYQPVATIPEGYRPPILIRTGGAASSGRACLIEIAPTGEFRIAWNNMGSTQSAPSWGAVSGSYTVD